MVTLNAENITVGGNINIDSTVVEGDVKISMQGLSAEDRRQLEDLEEKIVEAKKSKNMGLVKELVGLAFAISKKVGEYFVVKHLSGG